MRVPLPILPLLAASLSVAPLAAQAPPPPAPAAETITADDVIRHIRVIADDSMLGRDTPSRGLELTARYVADHFRRCGLRPGGDRGGFVQRYAIARRKLDAAGSAVTFGAGRSQVRARFTSAARLVQGAVPPGPVAGPVLVVGGGLVPDDAGRVPLAGRVVLYLPNRTGPGADQVLRALYLAGPRAIVTLSGLDSAAFSLRLLGQTRERTAIDMGVSRPAVVEVREDAVAPVLAAAGVNPPALRASATAVIHEAPGLTARLDLRETVVSRGTAPNVVGILEGSDPALRREYVVFSAHMDHIGVTPGQPDSVNNGADDDASGTAGVIELAEAFSRPGARPRRSLIFLTVSGEEKGLWGSHYFTEHPPVPLREVVADLNIDMIGRNWPDTIVAIGREHSDLGATLDRVTAAHPELGLTPIDDPWPEERFYFRSDHYNFARKGVPILFFFNGVHEDYHRVTDSPDKIDAEKESRVLRLLFYLGREVANAPERPRWKRESYQEIVEHP